MEDIAPKKPGPAKDTDTTVAIYFDNLTRASIKEKTAERWRAAGRLGDERLQAWFEKVRQKGILPGLTDLYRMDMAEARVRTEIKLGGMLRKLEKARTAVISDDRKKLDVIKKVGLKHDAAYRYQVMSHCTASTTIRAMPIAVMMMMKVMSASP